MSNQQLENDLNSHNCLHHIIFSSLSLGHVRELYIIIVERHI